MIAIRAEIQSVIDGQSDRQDNVLKNAPHTAAAVTANEWKHAYSRDSCIPATFRAGPLCLRPSVYRIDNPYGDRNLMCTCPPVEAFV